MNKFLSLVLLSIFAAPALLLADGAAPAPAKTNPTEEAAPASTAPKKADDVGIISLKTKSTFNMDAGTRSPFWPISWKPAGKVAGSGGTDQGEVPASAFLVSTITLDGTTRFAIINGKSMQEGTKFGLQIGTQIYQVMVKQIEDGRVILARHDQEIIVPLRRK